LNKSWYSHCQRGHLSPQYLRNLEFHNASNNFNNQAFATLQADGSITAWGHSGNGGTGAPTGSGYTKIYSNSYAFAALKTQLNKF
jgi:hypothetical protein